jgi:hypothetical protein
MIFDEGRPLPRPHGSEPEADWKMPGALDAANNRLQELMQLFYLLSRDPAIPQDARYHVTLAQSEIALLTRVMRNIANEQEARSENEATG